MVHVGMAEHGSLTEGASKREAVICFTAILERVVDEQLLRLELLHHTVQLQSVRIAGFSLRRIPRPATETLVGLPTDASFHVLPTRCVR